MKKLLFFAMILVVGLTACKIKSTVVLKNSTDSLIFVDYNKGIHEMIMAGKYAYFDNQIISDVSFPLPAAKIGKQETLVVRLFHFSKTVSEADILAAINKTGFRPAILPELLAFGAQYPDCQKQHPIAAVGSFWQDHGGVPYIGFDTDRRTLDVNWNHYEWSNEYYFLAVQTKFLGYNN